MAEAIGRQPEGARVGGITRPERHRMAGDPLTDPSTHYPIQVKGNLDAQRLKGFGRLAGLWREESIGGGEWTVLHAHTDQSRRVGLVRALQVWR